VFVNKVLMDPKKGFGFVFATSLCSMHFFCSGAFIKASEAVGYGQAQSMPFKGEGGVHLHIVRSRKALYLQSL